MISVKVNQQTHQIQEDLSIQQLVEQLQVSTKGIAIAINNSVVKKTDWSLKELQNGDDVLIIKSTQGG